MIHRSRISLAYIQLASLCLMGTLACSLPLAIKNLAETAVPSSPTLPSSLTPTPIPFTPAPSETATNPPTIAPATLTNVPPTPTIFATVEMPTTTPTPKRSPIVLWDLSHGPRLSESGVYYEPKGMYESLTKLLGENGISTVSNYIPLDQADLSSNAALVVSMSSAVEKEFSKGEVQSILEFIQKGGGLLILSENPGFTNRIQPLLDLFNVQISSHKIPGPIQQFQSQPIFAGVDEVRFLFDGCSFIITSPPAEAIGFYEGEPVIVSVGQYPGRVLIIGDSNLFDNRGLPKNGQFARNVFRWLLFII